MPILALYIPRTNFGTGIPDIGPVRLFSYLIIIFFLIESAITKAHIKLLNKWIAILLIYTFIVIASVTWSNLTYNTFVLQSIFDSVFIPLCIAQIAINAFCKKENVHLYIKHIITAGFILALISILQMILGIESKGELRSAATLGNANALAIFLVLTIPCFIYTIEKEIVSRKFGWLLIGTLIGGVIFTVSRKGIIAMIMAFLLYYILKKEFKKVFISCLIFAILGGIFSGYKQISHRFEKNELEQQTSGRLNMVYVGLQMFFKSPFIGLGYKGYRNNFSKFFPGSRKNYDAHNIYVTALTDYGLLGFIPFSAIFIYPLIYSKKILTKNHRKKSMLWQKDMAVICISSIIPFMICGFFAGSLFYQQILVSLLYTHVSFIFSDEQNPEVRTSRVGRLT